TGERWRRGRPPKPFREGPAKSELSPFSLNLFDLGSLQSQGVPPISDNILYVEMYANRVWRAPVAKTIEKLSDREVRAKTKPGLYADGANLWLQIAKGGSKSWIFRYMRNGRARKMGLGSFNTVSLADARAKALACRKMLDLDGDPIEARKAKRLAEQL